MGTSPPVSLSADGALGDATTTNVVRPLQDDQKRKHMHSRTFTGLVICNVDTSAITITVQIYDGTNTTVLIDALSVGVGETLLMSREQGDARRLSKDEYVQVILAETPGTTIRYRVEYEDS